MDNDTRREMIELVRERGTAALGTSYNGSPLVSLVLYACAHDLTDLYIHVSRLAQHTEVLLANPRVGLMIVKHDLPTRNPLSLARVSMQGTATVVEPTSDEYTAVRSLYLTAHPSASINFQLPDFLLFRIRPESARFIAGFGRIFDLDRKAWLQLASESA